MLVLLHCQQRDLHNFYLKSDEAMQIETDPVDNPILAHHDAAVPENLCDMPDDRYDIPPFLRLPPIGSKERLEMTLSAMDRRLAWLAERGMRPNQSTIERRAEMVRELGNLSQMLGKVGAGETVKR